MENWNLFGIYDCSKISGTKYIKNQYKTYKISVQTNSKKSRPAAVCTYFSGIISTGAARQKIHVTKRNGGENERNGTPPALFVGVRVCLVPCLSFDFFQKKQKKNCAQNTAQKNFNNPNKENQIKYLQHLQPPTLPPSPLILPRSPLPVTFQI